VFILAHPVNFPCGRKPEHQDKTHDFRQSVDRLFSHESAAKIEPTISEVKGTSSDDCNLRKWELGKRELFGNTTPEGWSVFTQFRIFPISMSVDITVYQYGKMFYIFL
jgi:hypothetical protein